MLRKAVVTVAALVAAGLVPASAFAASATVTGTVSGSTLGVSTSATPSFSANLDSGDSTQTFSVPLTLQDTRGTGAGWNLTVTSTQYTTGGGTPSTLATTASSITGVTSVCASGTCTNPTNSIAFPVGVPAASTPPTAAKFYDASANTGMGKFTVTPTIGVFVPQNSVAGTYNSTLSIAVVTGP